MKTINIIRISLFVVIIMLISFLIKDNIHQREENARLELNLDQYGRQVSSLEFTEKELKQELDKREKTIVAVDSILRKRNLRISQLERVIATRMSIVDRDTTFLPLETSVPIYLPEPSNSAQIYKTVFKTEKSCISIEGFILSIDPDPAIAITKREAKVNIYNIDVKRRWWQFWKLKYEKVISSECGEVELTEIKIE